MLLHVSRRCIHIFLAALDVVGFRIFLPKLYCPAQDFVADIHFLGGMQALHIGIIILKLFL